MPQEVADGASESAHGKAVHTGHLPHGEGPELAERPDQRSPAHAQAVHGEGTVELEQGEGTLRARTETDRRGYAVYHASGPYGF
jgi:hypothetical protein